jgi:hypothetical protein
MANWPLAFSELYGARTWKTARITATEVITWVLLLLCMWVWNLVFAPSGIVSQTVGSELSPSSQELLAMRFEVLTAVIASSSICWDIAVSTYTER